MEWVGGRWTKKSMDVKEESKERVKISVKQADKF